MLENHFCLLWRPKNDTFTANFSLYVYNAWSGQLYTYMPQSTISIEQYHMQYQIKLRVYDSREHG